MPPLQQLSLDRASLVETHDCSIAVLETALQVSAQTPEQVAQFVHLMREQQCLKETSLMDMYAQVRMVSDNAIPFGCLCASLPEKYVQAGSLLMRLWKWWFHATVKRRHPVLKFGAGNSFNSDTLYQCRCSAGADFWTQHVNSTKHTQTDRKKGADRQENQGADRNNDTI